MYSSSTLALLTCIATLGVATRLERFSSTCFDKLYHFPSLRFSSSPGRTATVELLVHDSPLGRSCAEGAWSCSQIRSAAGRLPCLPSRSTLRFWRAFAQVCAAMDQECRGTDHQVSACAALFLSPSSGPWRCFCPFRELELLQYTPRVYWRLLWTPRPIG